MHPLGANKPKDVDPKLLTPFFHTFCCCLPPKLRQCLHCDVEFPEVGDMGAMLFFCYLNAFLRVDLV